jgi:hypothetical protein
MKLLSASNLNGKSRFFTNGWLLVRTHRPSVVRAKFAAR